MRKNRTFHVGARAAALTLAAVVAANVITACGYLQGV